MKHQRPHYRVIKGRKVRAGRGRAVMKFLAYKKKPTKYLEWKSNPKNNIVLDFRDITPGMTIDDLSKQMFGKEFDYLSNNEKLELEKRMNSMILRKRSRPHSPNAFHLFRLQYTPFKERKKEIDAVMASGLNDRAKKAKLLRIAKDIESEVANIKKNYVMQDRIVPKKMKRSAMKALELRKTPEESIVWSNVPSTFRAKLKKGEVIRGGDTIDGKTDRYIFLQAYGKAAKPKKRLSPKELRKEIIRRLDIVRTSE